MDKKVGLVIGLMVFVSICVMGLFVFNNHSADSENDRPSEKVDKQDVDKEDSIAFKDIQKTGNRITERFDITMNDKDIVFTIDYTFMNENGESAYVFGRMGDYEFFSLSEDGTLVDSEKDVLDKFIDRVFKEDYLKSMFTVNNFKFIKGEDEKTYLLVISNKYSAFIGKTSELYVFDDELKLVEGDINYNGCQNDDAMTIMTMSVGYEGKEELAKNGYEDTFGVCEDAGYCYVNVKIEDNKINYLKVLDVNVLGDPDYGTMEEREYTIKNGKLNYNVKNTFRITTAAGQAC